MCKFLLNLKGKLCANKTNSYVLPVKSINLFFNNSIDKQFKVINLNSLSTIDFQILEINEEDKNQYQLFAVLDNKNDNVLNIAKFNTKAEAEEAVLKIRGSLTKTSHELIKIIGTTILLGVLVGIIFNIVYLTNSANNNHFTTIESASTNKPNNGSHQQYQPTGLLPSEEEVQKSLPKIEKNGTPAISEGDLKQMFEKAQAEQNAGMNAPTSPQSQQQPVEQAPQEPPLSPADKLLQGLK